MEQFDSFCDEWVIIESEEIESKDLNNLTSNDIINTIQTCLDELGNIKFNLAITGESGSGKSSFVNALRGIGDDEELSAPTGVVETTMEPTPYSHPKYPDVVVWDLPGIGTPNFKADEYLEKVKFDDYDLFIIVTSERFKSSSVQLAEQIQKMKKRFYFVRSKIDDNIRAEKRKKNFNQDQMLNKIRQDCINGLLKCKIKSPAVFLISSYELGLYDFNLLEETLEKDLHKHKNHALLQSLLNMYMKIHQGKRETLQESISWKALLSVAMPTVDIPGHSLAVNLDILVQEIRRYYNSFGLDDQSLKNLSLQSAVPVEKFKACCRSPLNKEISKDVVMKMLTSEVAPKGSEVKHWLSHLPMLGSIPTGPLSFVTAKTLLEKCLQELADDAKEIVEMAFKSKIRNIDREL